MSAPNFPRTELYRVLADPLRLQILAVLEHEELTVGELAEVLGQSQPQMSKKVSALRKASLLSMRKDGARTYLHTTSIEDAVVRDACDEGRRLAIDANAFDQMNRVIGEREDAGRAFFNTEDEVPTAEGTPLQSAHLFSLSQLFGQRRLAVDVGTGRGEFLDIIAPAFQRVIGIDRSRAQLAHAAQRIKSRCFRNVRLREGTLGDANILQEIDDLGGAQVLTLVRTLHHSAKPRELLTKAFRCLVPGGRILVVDYHRHDDESMRSQGDVWLGFAQDELKSMLEDAGFEQTAQCEVPQPYVQASADAQHLSWQVVSATKPANRKDLT